MEPTRSGLNVRETLLLVGLLVSQAVLVLLGLDLTAALAPPWAVGVAQAFAPLARDRRYHTLVKTPWPALLFATACLGGTAAWFALAPDDMTFKLRMIRVSLSAAGILMLAQIMRVWIDVAQRRVDA